MTLIAADRSRVLEAAATLRPARAGAGVARSGRSLLGEAGADSALDGFGRTLSARLAQLDHLVDRAAAVLAVYAVNFERAGG
jgi:hypothetical protein